MSTRIRLNTTRDRDVLGAMLNLEATVRKSSLEPALLELVKVRVSQINGCGHCLDMHTKDARAAGESEQRLYLLSAWSETSLYTDRERAALRWAEAVTRLENQRVPEDVYQLAREQFNEAEMVALTLAVASINAWNRFAVSFQYSAGSYQPGSLNR